MLNFDIQSDVLNGGSYLQKAREALSAAELGDYRPMLKSGLFDSDLTGSVREYMRKAEGVNYPLQGQGFDSGSLPQGQFAPLIPQAIDNVVTSITYRDEHLRLFKMIPKKSWNTTVYEYAQVVENGSEGLDGFVGEGALGGYSEAKYRRAISQVKYLTEKFSVTDVATMVSGTVGNIDLVNQRTTQAATHLMRKIEEMSVWGDSSVNPNQWDGIIAQVRDGAPDNFLNSNGGRVDVDRIQEIVANMEEGPIWSSVNTIFCTSTHYRHLAQDLDLKGYMKYSESNKNFRLGADGIEFVTPFGRTVKITPLHFLDRGRRTPIPRAAGGAGAPAAILPTVTRVAGPVTGSNVTASDVGRDWYFTFEVYGDEGTFRTAIVGPVTPLAAGDAFQFDAADSAFPREAAGSIRYYRAFAASVASGAAAPTDKDFRPADTFARNAANAGATRVNMLLDVRPYAAPMIYAQWDESVIKMIEFLPMFRRPLPVPNALRQELALLYFATPVVAQPLKMVVDMNVENTI
jgi:hypothetical protein